MLDVYMLKNGKFHKIEEYFELNATFNEIEDMFSLQMAAKGLKFEIIRQ